MRQTLASLALLAVMLGAAALAVPAEPASADIDVRSNVATNQFPNGIQFQFFFSSDAPVSDVRLRYRILPDGVSATVRPQCTESQVRSCQAVVGNTAQVYIVPGAEVVYSWEVTDQAGGRFSTEEQTVVYEDGRFQWGSVSEGNLTVYYYFGDEASVRNMLQTAQETIATMSDLLNTQLDFPVKIWVYRTAQDMQPAVASRRGQGPNDSVQTLGEVGASDTALVSRDTDFLDIVRHELAHIVTGAATKNYLAEIPIWVNEGLSTYQQLKLLPGEEAALQDAIRRNQPLPIPSLGAAARGTANVVSLFYAQSGAIIRFMIDSYGPDKFGEFIAALARDTADGALQTVYGFDQTGLEDAWRASLGLPAVGAQPSPTVAPTATAATTGQSQPNTGSSANRNDSDDGDGFPVLLVVAGALGALVVGLLGAAGYLVLQSRKGG
jgi:hypothetical protein